MSRGVGISWRSLVRMSTNVIIFAVRLLLAPTLIGLVSLAGKRWGATVSGWLVGLPLTSGPVSLLLALEYGTTFASNAAQGTTIGLISLAVFCLVYSWLSLYMGWLSCLMLSWTAYLFSTALLSFVILPLVFTFVIVAASLTIGVMLMPKSKHVVVMTQSWYWDTPLRMLIAAIFVLVLTGLAGILGPHLSGLLAPFPLFATILAVFTHRLHGALTTCRLLRGVMIGSFTFGVFFLIVGSTIARWGTAPAFALAILVTLFVHTSSLLLLRFFEPAHRSTN